MKFLKRDRSDSERIGVLPGAFNPVTRAHEALARAALQELDEVVLVLPRAFPHKSFELTTLEQRAEMLCAAAQAHPGLSVALSDGGLFVEIARELRRETGAPSVVLLCGADAADRMLGWEHGEPVESILEQFPMWVAARQTGRRPPESVSRYIRELDIGRDWSELSATEVRTRIAAGREWEHLVPAGVVELVRRYYS